MEILDAITGRGVIVALAILGALVATLGSFLLRKSARVDPRMARLVLRSGYAIAWLSVALFIVAGFRAD